MRRLLLAALLLATPAAAQTEETPDVFPQGAHRDETFYFCVACHGATLVTRQGMSRERWDDTLTWMSEKHAMPVLEGEDRKQILDYLATAFPPKTTTGTWKSPFAPSP